MASLASETNSKPVNAANTTLLPLYHLIPLKTYESLSDISEYVPPTYVQDGGFIHLTEEASVLLSVANQFYKAVQGKYLVLELDPSKLTDTVKFESPAPVGNISNTNEKHSTMLFPHLYGKINKEAITGTFDVTRAEEDGTFLSIVYPLVEILPNHIYLGTSGTAKDEKLLQANNIEWKLCVANEIFNGNSNEEAPNYDDQHVNLPITKGDLLFEKTLSLLQDRETLNEKIIVYGTFSRSRALVPVIAYIMYKSKITFEKAYEVILAKWPRAKDLESHYKSQLKSLGEVEGAHDSSIAEDAVKELTSNNGGNIDLNDVADNLDEDDVENVVYLDENNNGKVDEDSDGDENVTDEERLLQEQKEKEQEEDAKGVVDISTAKFLEHKAEVYSVATFKNTETNNKIVLSGGGDDNAYLWFPDENNKSIKLQGHTDTVSSVAFNADGKLAATGSMDSTVKIWSVEEPGKLIETLEGPGEDIEFISWHPKGNVVLAGSVDTTVWMWMAGTGTARCMQVFAGHEDSVTCGQFLPNGKAIVTGCADGTVRIWAPKTGKCRYAFNRKTCKGDPSAWHEHGSAIVQLAVNQTNDLILTGSIDGSSRLAHIQNKKSLATLAHRREGALLGHTVEAVDFSPTMPWCLTGGSAGLLKVWDLQTTNVRFECRHDAGIIKAKFLKGNPPLLASCSVDQTVRIWDSRTGEESMKLTGHTNIVLDFDIIEKDVFSCSDDGSVLRFKNLY
eukprot:g6988.t1